MTALGAIAVARRLPYRRRQNVWRVQGRDGLRYNNLGVLSWVVQVSGTPLPGCMVRVFYRPTGRHIGGGRTDASGLFTLGGLDDTDVANYFAIAFDPAGGTNYNALIYDQLTPYFDSSAYARTADVEGSDFEAIGAHEIGFGTIVTWNPSDKNAGITLSQEDRAAENPSFGSGFLSVRATLPKNSGKYYWEVDVGMQGGYGAQGIGIIKSGVGLSGTLESKGGGARVYTNDGFIVADTVTQSSGNGGWSNHSIVQIAVDYDAGKGWFGRNNTYFNSGDPGAGTNEAFTITANDTYYPAINIAGQPAGTQFPSVGKFSSHYGTYTPPSGFLWQGE